jgi:hypothetical protein
LFPERKKDYANEIILSAYLFVPPPPHQLLNQLVDFNEMQWEGHAIESDLDAINFNAIAAAIPKWRTFRLLRWVQNLHKLT